MKLKRVRFLVILFIVVAFYIFYINQEKILDESTRTVQYFHWLKMSLTYHKESTIQIEFSVTEGAFVDLYVFNKSGYDDFFYLMNYGRGLFMPMISKFNITTTFIQFEVPFDESFYVIINNAGTFKDSAIPIGNVTFYIKISSRN